MRRRGSSAVVVTGQSRVKKRVTLLNRRLDARHEVGNVEMTEGASALLREERVWLYGRLAISWMLSATMRC
jgi:hypothetical protein